MVGAHVYGRNLIGSVSVQSLILAFVDATQARQREQDLARRALYDDLTGLPIRTLLAERLQSACDQRSGTGALMMVDLDGFKLVNDRSATSPATFAGRSLTAFESAGAVRVDHRSPRWRRVRHPAAGDHGRRRREGCRCDLRERRRTDPRDPGTGYRVDRCDRARVLGDDPAAGGSRDARRQVSRHTVATHCRDQDKVFHKGGEEFTIVLPGIAVEAAQATRERLRAAIEDLALEHHGADDVPVVTVTIGTATRQDDDLARALSDAADTAFACKVAGLRNRVTTARS